MTKQRSWSTAERYGTNSSTHRLTGPIANFIQDRPYWAILAISNRGMQPKPTRKQLSRRLKARYQNSRSTLVSHCGWQCEASSESAEAYREHYREQTTRAEIKNYTGG